MLTSSRFFYLFWPPPGNTGIYISSFPCPRLRDTGSSSEKQCDCFLPHISSFLFHKLRTTVSHSMVIKVLRECKSLMSSRCSKTLVFLFFFCNTLFNNNSLEIYIKDNDILALRYFSIFWIHLEDSSRIHASQGSHRCICSIRRVVKW